MQVCVFSRKELCNLLNDILIEKNFVRRGSAFFRAQGGEVLQTIRFDYERAFNHFELNFGLYSLYSKLSHQQFTSNNCICPYPICSFIGCKTAVSVSIINGLSSFNIASPKEQIKILEHTGLAWLDQIQTQEQLIQAYHYLETQLYKEILWNNFEKLAPYLVNGNLQAADKVINAILQQHLGSEAWTTQPWSDTDYTKYMNLFPGEDTELLQIHYWICSKDAQSIAGYLQSNYCRNKEWGNFCIK